MDIHRYRTIFLSDFHIGAKSFDARALLNFLNATESDILYLVGDIFDGWKFNKRWYWAEEYSQILDCLVRKVHEGTKLIYLPGNHDEEMRFIPLLTKHKYAQNLGIKIRDKAIHTTLDGRKFIVLHGDQFDRKILSGAVSKLSDKIYDWLIEILNAHGSNTIMINGKRKRFSLAKYLSKHGQRALAALNNFEGSVYRMAKSRKVEGLICGHTHIPALKSIKGVIYGNPGNWLRSGHNALVETYEGKIELLECAASNLEEPDPTLYNFCDSAGNEAHIRNYKYRYVTDRIVKEVRRIWPTKYRKSKVLVQKSEEISLHLLVQNLLAPFQDIRLNILTIFKKRGQKNYGENPAC